MGHGGDIYGTPGQAPGAEMPPLDIAGLSNQDLLTAAINTGQFAGLPQDEQDLIRSFVGGTSFGPNDQGIMNYNPDSDPNIHPNHAARIRTIQNAVQRMQAGGATGNIRSA